MSIGSAKFEPPVAAPVETLLEIARRHGTPAYAFDVRCLRRQVDQLRAHLPGAVEILYSLKANASLGICDVFADCGIGADVASAGELATAVEAGFSARQIFVAGPYKSRETIEQLRALPEAIISIDSLSELQSLAEQNLPNRAVLRLRPDFESSAVVQAGSESRFGVIPEDLAQCRDYIGSRGLDVIGFHVFAGSQVLDPQRIIDHLRGAMDLSLRAADTLEITPELINLGGGFGTPYGPDDAELDLVPIGRELESLIDRVSPARLVLELGRYLVAQSGWYLTSVVGHQTYLGRHAVVVDGGTHQCADLCGLGLRCKANPPMILNASGSERIATDILGCLSLPADILAESCELPELSRDDVMAFPNAGAYGLWASPAIFHGSSLPAEVAFDGSTIQPMRTARSAQSIMDGQLHVFRNHYGSLDK